MDIMNFPQTVDEFMEQYKIVDREEVYTNGAELIPIFRMKQWFEHEALGKDINVPSKWVPVTEELPKKKDEYLVTYHPCYWDNVEDDVKEVGIDSFRGKESWAKNKYQKVVAWAEKPEPWEGE